MVPFVGQTYEHYSLNVSAQKTLNLYPEILNDDGVKANYILRGTPGTSLFKDLGFGANSVCRGLHYTVDSRLFGVYGAKVVEVSSVGDIVHEYDISNGSTVSMADNGSRLLIADGSSIWAIDLSTNTLSSETLPFSMPEMVKFINNRFVSFGKDQNVFWWTDLDGSTWDALNFASAEGSADNIISMASTRGELVFFGPKSYEVWRGSSDKNLPFVRVNGSFSNIGCGAKYSVSEINETVFFLGTSRAGKNSVYKIEGYNAVKISNPAISELLGEADKSGELVNITSDAVGFTYSQQDHTFYVLTLIQGNKTICYDLTTNLWHERSTRDSLTNVQNRWEPIFAVYAYERIITGNSVNPYLIELDLNKFDEYDGRLITSLRRSPTYWDEMRLMFHKSFILDIETGVGLTNQNLQGHDPQVMLRYSDDSGHTWSSERWASLGKVGNYLTRVKFRRLGRSRNRVYEVSITDPVKRVLLGANIEAERGFHS